MKCCVNKNPVFAMRAQYERFESVTFAKLDIRGNTLWRKLFGRQLIF